MAISEFTKRALGLDKPTMSPFTQRIVEGYDFVEQEIPTSTELPETYKKSIAKSGVIKQGTFEDITTKISPLKKLANIFLPKALEFKPKPISVQEEFMQKQLAAEEVAGINKIRIPFAKKATFDYMGPDPLQKLLVNVATRTPELLGTIPTGAYNFFRKNLNAIIQGKPVETKQVQKVFGVLDPARFGIDKDEMLQDTITKGLAQYEIEKKNHPERSDYHNALMASAKTVVPDVLDVLFAYDITKNVVKLGIVGAKFAVKQLPDSLLFKIQKQNISPVGIRDALTGSTLGSASEKKIAESFIKGLTTEERRSLFGLLKSYESARLKIPITTGAQQTLLGKFAGVKAPITKLPPKIGGLLPAGKPSFQAGFINLNAIGNDIKLLAKQAKSVSELKNLLSSKQLAILATKGIAVEALYNAIKVPTPKVEKGITTTIEPRGKAGQIISVNKNGENIANFIFGEPDKRLGLVNPELRFTDPITGKSRNIVMTGATPEAIQKELLSILEKYGLVGKVEKDIIPPGLQPLAQEARKYKSAEEFVKAQTTDKMLPTFQQDLKQWKRLTDMSDWAVKDELGYVPKELRLYHYGKSEPTRGSFWSSDQYHAESFKQSGDKLFTKTIPAEDLKVMGEGRIIGKNRLDPKSSGTEFIYDPIKKTARESQLTDIYNQAVRGEPTKALTVVRGEEFALGEMGKLKQPTEGVLRKRLKDIRVRAIKKETIDSVKSIYDKKVAKIKDSKEILQRRRTFIKAIQKQFNLSDADLKSITRRDIRLMSNFEFHKFLDDIRNRSEKLAEWYQAKNELMSQIQEKNIDIESVRASMNFPPVSKMTTSQLRELDQAIQPFMKDDVFLSKRKLETIERTELAGVKTYREVRERLAKKLGVNPEDLNNIKITELDRFKGMSALSEKDPFFKMMVEETSKLRIIREAEYLDIEQQANKLARKIKTTFFQKLIPQQKNIRKWFEAEDKNTVELTPAETGLVKFMQDEWIKALEYLVKQKALSKGMSSENYFTHIRRGILEAVKEDGFIKGFKEMFNQYKLDEQNFDILDSQTGQVLALDKFFKFAVRRSNLMKPTENILSSFLTYMRTFKKKQALDEMVPLIDIYANALTPTGATKEGLLLHGSLIRFTKEWLNTQKGRRITLSAKQGGKIEWFLNSGRALTALLDIALNIPVTVATQIGEMAITYELLGKIGMARGYYRLATPRGRRIIQKYRNFTGKNPWGQLIEPMRDIGDRLMEGIFVLFKDANIRRNEVALLASLTEEELAKETILPERLAQLKIEIGRYGVIEGAKSIVGATPEAGVALQYKSWAVPIVGSQIRNASYLAKWVKSLGKDEKVKAKRAAIETARMIEIGLFVIVVGGLFIDEEDDSFLGKLKKRAMQEALTLYGASAAVISSPRLLTFLIDIGNALISIVKLETYKSTSFGEYEAGELKGTKKLLRLFTPRAIKQFEKKPEKGLDDIKKEIIEDIESGRLSISAAKEKLTSELTKLANAEKKKRFELSLDEYKKDLITRLESKEITVEEAKEEFIDYSEANVDSFESPDESSFIDKVILYSKAIGVDPVSAFIFIFQGERIRKIENKTIIVERMPTEESQAIKTERGATGKELILDHTIPLQLGGSNNKNNLKLVSVDEWENYTEVENYLGNKLRAGLIDKKTAQQLIKDFKDGKIKREDIMGVRDKH